jgi:hypothetical protein
MPRNLLPFVFGMKKCLFVLLCVASPVIHAQAADPGDQLLGFWRPDMTKTLALAKKSNRELGPIMQNIMGKMVFEFQKDKMIVHGLSGFSSDNPPVPYSVKGVDQTADSLTLSANGKETKVRFHRGQMALNDPEQGWLIFNRMSEEDFAKREGGGAKIEVESGDKAPAAGKLEGITTQPSPDKPAAGKVSGKVFKVEKATLEEGSLKLWQGEGFSTHLEQFEIDLSRKNIENFSGKTFTVELSQEPGIEISLAYSGEEKGEIKSRSYMKDYSMKLEFGNAKSGKIPGKIHLRLPDKAGSFVVGTFVAETQ